MAQTADAALVVSLEARVDAFEKAFNRAGDIADRKFSQIEKRTKEAGERMREQIGSSVEGVNKIFETIGIGLGLNELKEMADAFSNLKARIDAAAGSQEKGAEIMERLGQVARRTYSSLDDTADAYLRNTRVLSGLGYSTETQLKYQEALNDALVLSGTRGDKAAEVQEALTKALADGGVTTKQLNILFENGGRVAQVLADGLGVSIIQLKKMGDEGKITSNVILQSLVGSLTKLRAEMALRPETFGDSLTVLKNALGEYIGKLAQSEGVTSTLGASVIFLADHIDTVAKGAASAAAIMLSAYVPALARAALAQTTVLATNPFLLMATAVGAASFAIAEFGDKLQPIEGDLANIQDYTAVLWTDLKSGASKAASTIEGAFIQVANLISSALGGGRVAMADLLDDATSIASAMIGAFQLVYDTVLITFSKLPQAVAEAVLDAVNGLIATVEAGLNAVIRGVNAAVGAINKIGGAVGVTLGSVGAVDLGRIENNFAGAGKVAGDAYVKALQDALKDRVGDALAGLRKDANKHAEERQHEAKGEAGSGLDSTDKPVIVHSNKDANDFEKAMREEKEKLATLQAETAARRSFSGSLEEEEAASKRAEIAQNLLNAAQHAGVEINDETISRIADLADAYSKASSEAIALAKSQQEAEARTKDLESTGKSAMSGFVEDLAHGKTAAEALRDALTKLSDKMLNLGMDALWKSMMDKGGHGVFEGISKLFDTGEEKPAYAPGSSLGALKSAAANTAHMSVTAGSVTVTGLGAGSAPGAASIAGALPDHPHTPTPEASADGYKDPWYSAFATRDQAKAASSGARQAVEAYYGKPLTDSEYKSLTSATSAEASGGTGNPQEQAMITASILNRAKTNPGGIEGALHAKDQFQAVTGTALNGHQPSAAFVNGPDAARLAQIENANKSYLSSVSPDQTNFTAVSASAYGPGTDIGYRNGLLANGGSIYGGSVFNTALPDPTTQLASVTPQLTTFTQSLTKADTGLGQFSGGLGDALKGILGGLGGGGGGGAGGLGGILSGIGGLFGFADGGMISGDGTGTSDSNLAMVSDGEFIVNAGATAKNKALLTAINSGKAPRFGASVPSVASIVNSRTNDASVTNHNYTVNNNINTPNADSFRRSSGQIAADANVHIQRMGVKNG
jgi:tape measure domain-containing protein